MLQTWGAAALSTRPAAMTGPEMLISNLQLVLSILKQNTPCTRICTWGTAALSTRPSDPAMKWNAASIPGTRPPASIGSKGFKGLRWSY